MPLKKDDIARIKAPVVQGVISKIKFDPDTGAKLLLLTWTDGDGAEHERWCAEDELEAAPAE